MVTCQLYPYSTSVTSQATQLDFFVCNLCWTETSQVTSQACRVCVQPGVSCVRAAGRASGRAVRACSRTCHEGPRRRRGAVRSPVRPCAVQPCVRAGAGVQPGAPSAPRASSPASGWRGRGTTGVGHGEEDDGVRRDDKEDSGCCGEMAAWRRGIRERQSDK